MVTIEIGRALSDDEDDVVYVERPPTQQPLVAPVKCESDAVVAVAASNGARGDHGNNVGDDDDDGGLKPTTTGEAR